MGFSQIASNSGIYLHITMRKKNYSTNFPSVFIKICDNVVKRVIFCMLYLVFITNFAIAQDSDTRQKEIFFGIGPAAYKGDLNDSYSKWSMMVHAGIKLNRFKKAHGNFALTIGSVTGQNINYAFNDGSQNAPEPNRFFTTSIVGFNYELHYNILNKEKIKVYASQGIGLMRFQPQDEFNASLIDQLSTRAQNETYGNITLTLPTQIGLLYVLPNDFSVGAQLGYHNTLTDYLDNISDWGTKAGHDNMFSFRVQVYVPVNL